MVYFDRDDDKVTLHTRIKTEYQAALGDKITLNSFLISTTAFEEFAKKWKVEDETELNKLGVFLSATPVKAILEAAIQ